MNAIRESDINLFHFGKNCADRFSLKCWLNNDNINGVLFLYRLVEFKFYSHSASNQIQTNE